MAYIIPNNECYFLAGAEVDRDLANVKYYSSASAQFSDMVSHSVAHVSNLYYIRDNIIKVEIPVSTLCSCNYLMFNNTSYENKWFYCFIDEVEYINNECTQVRYTIDEWQTWFLNCTLGQCFVEREHVMSDEFGEHTIPENIECGEMVTPLTGTVRLTSYSNLSTASTAYGIELAITDEQLAQVGASLTFFTNKVVGKVYHGTKLGYGSANQLTTFIDAVVQAGYTNTIVRIFSVPDSLKPVDGQESDIERDEINLPLIPKDFDGFTPHNNKMYISDYVCWEIMVPDGQSMILKPELFTEEGNPTEDEHYLVRQALKTTYPSVLLTPKLYKSYANTNYEDGITLEYGVLGSYTYDSYQAELASYGMGEGIITGKNNAEYYKYQYQAANTANKGVVRFFQDLFTLNFAGANDTLVDTQSEIWDTIAQQSKDSHDTTTLCGNYGEDMLWSISQQDAYCMIKQARREYAEMIDKYFDMFGYAVNEMKVPNISGRPSWNYVKCGTVTIRGNIPSTAEKKITDMLKTGVTLWKTTFGNYSADNTL